MHIIGFAGREAIPYAVKLGVALQLTNILRDVREDWAAGRVYLPQEELTAFGLNDADISALSTTGFRGEDGVTDRWRAFMRFQIERNRQLYSEATPGIAWLDPAGRFAIAAAVGLYRDILETIAARDGDVFSQRAKPRNVDRSAAWSGCGGGRDGRPCLEEDGRVEQRRPRQRSRRHRTRLSDGWYVACSVFRKSRGGLRSAVSALYFTGLVECIGEDFMRIVITGGAGFIGRALAADLAATGYEVVILSRNPAKAAGLPSGVRAERWDGRTAAGWGQLADGALAIVNLAGENLAGGGFLPARWTPERKQLIRQ